LVHHTGEQPAVKLLDFGLAKLTATSTTIVPCEEDDEYPDGGLIFGTPLYMSPEQARGLQLDHRSDIYSLGCVAYELVLGVRPFPQAQTTTAIYASHLHEAPPSPRTIWPAIPPQLNRILFAMLAKDPADRPALAEIRTTIKGLRRSAHPQRTGITPVSISPRGQRASTMLVGSQPRPTSRPTLILVMVAICILAAGALLGIVVSSAIRARGHSAQNVHSPTPLAAHPESANFPPGPHTH
jgi:serine/threonine protein kinase